MYKKGVNRQYNTWSGGPGLLAIEVEFLAVSPAPLTGTSTKPDTLPVTGSLRTSKVVARGWVLVAPALSNLRGRGVLSQNRGGPVHLTQKQTCSLTKRVCAKVLKEAILKKISEDEV